MLKLNQKVKKNLKEHQNDPKRKEKAWKEKVKFMDKDKPPPNQKGHHQRRVSQLKGEVKSAKDQKVERRKRSLFKKLILKKLKVAMNKMLL